MGLLDSLIELQSRNIGKRENLAAQRDVARKASLLQPLLNQYGPDAAKAIGSAWIAGGPAADLANQRLAQAEQQAVSKLPLDEQIARLPLTEQAKIGSETALQRQRLLAGDETQQKMRIAEQRLALDQQKTVAYVNNLNYDNAMKATAAQISALGQGLKSEGDLRDEYQKAPAMMKGVQAVSSWQMLKQALQENNKMALQAAIVATAQIQEPGLAVRNDDRIAYSGSNPVIDQMVEAYNTAVSGEGLKLGTKQRLLALGTRLAAVHANNILQVTDEYRKLATKTPGARVDAITTGTGVDWDTVNFLSQVTKDYSGKGPGGR